MGCEVQACLKNYHFFCAKNDNAVLQTDGSIKQVVEVACGSHHSMALAADGEVSALILFFIFKLW